MPIIYHLDNSRQDYNQTVGQLLTYPLSSLFCGRVYEYDPNLGFKEIKDCYICRVIQIALAILFFPLTLISYMAGSLLLSCSPSHQQDIHNLNEETIYQNSVARLEERLLEINEFIDGLMFPANEIGNPQLEQFSPQELKNDFRVYVDLEIGRLRSHSLQHSSQDIQYWENDVMDHLRLMQTALPYHIGNIQAPTLSLYPCTPIRYTDRSLDKMFLGMLLQILTHTRLLDYALLRPLQTPPFSAEDHEIQTCIRNVVKELREGYAPNEETLQRMSTRLNIIPWTQTTIQECLDKVSRFSKSAYAPQVENMEPPYAASQPCSVVIINDSNYLFSIHVRSSNGAFEIKYDRVIPAQDLAGLKEPIKPQIIVQHLPDLDSL